nr:phage antirepressor KilAC domain-containing protein [Prevotella sp.]
AQLLLTSKEELVLMANQIVGDEVRGENEDTTNCLTATDVAKLWGMKVAAFNRMLVDMGLQKWRGGCYNINEKFEGLGFTKYRLHRYYAKKGPVKDILYMVWTPQGVEWLRTFVKDNATSQNGSVIVYEVKGVRYEVKIKN